MIVRSVVSYKGTSTKVIFTKTIGLCLSTKSVVGHLAYLTAYITKVSTETSVTLYRLRYEGVNVIFLSNFA